MLCSHWLIYNVDPFGKSTGNYICILPVELYFIYILIGKIYLYIYWNIYILSDFCLLPPTPLEELHLNLSIVIVREWWISHPLFFHVARKKSTRETFGWSTYTGWWFQTFFIFRNIWDNPSHWLIFFKMVKTTNQYTIGTRGFSRHCKFPEG